MVRAVPLRACPFYTCPAWPAFVCRLLLCSRMSQETMMYASAGALARGDADINLRFPHKGYREKIWDHAAGVVIVQEAGACISDASGQEQSSVLARTPLGTYLSRCIAYAICLHVRLPFCAFEGQASTSVGRRATGLQPRALAGPGRRHCDVHANSASSSAAGYQGACHPRGICNMTIMCSCKRRRLSLRGQQEGWQ